MEKAAIFLATCVCSAAFFPTLYFVHLFVFFIYYCTWQRFQFVYIIMLHINRQTEYIEANVLKPMNQNKEEEKKWNKHFEHKAQQFALISTEKHVENNKKKRMKITRGKRLAVRTDFQNEHKYPKSPFETLKLFDDRKI